jgi:transcriptional regulator with XRE-family HTH domain
MNIGKKIRELRVAKLMTQSELVGNEITRNMLSRIESDKALPSLSTLLFLSERLGVSAGYILDEERTLYESIYKKLKETKNWFLVFN